MNKRLITIVEILVVIAILSILAGLLFPALRKALDRSYRVVDAGYQRQLAISITHFSDDHQGLVPGIISGYKDGNRDMKVWPSDPAWNTVRGTSRLCFGSYANFLYRSESLHGLGTAAALGYIDNPDLFFPPAFQPAGWRIEGGVTGGVERVRWNQPEYLWAWRELTDGDDALNPFLMIPGIVYMAFALNNTKEPMNQQNNASHPNIKLSLIAEKHLETWCSPVLTVSANMDIINKKAGMANGRDYPEWGKSYGFVAWAGAAGIQPVGIEVPAPGVVASFYDGSARWVSSDELYYMENGKHALVYTSYVGTHTANYGGLGLGVPTWAMEEARPARQ
ncbi:MAG: type II secretion system protein [Planctomycetes bacterium]|nr:type II secretion system protein [Planctomycetota bacterium]